MNILLNYLVIIHVTAGVGALLFGLLAFFRRSNTPKHKPIGKIYFWCMTVIFVTGVILSLAKNLVFFFFIAVFSYYAVAIAYRALKLKELHKGQKPALVDWLIQIIAALVFMGAIVFALLTETRGSTYIIFVFAGLGLLGVYRNSQLIFKGPKESNYWLKMHIGQMMGSYIGAMTAFLVNQTDNIPIHPLFLWFGPTVLMVPIIVMELRKVKTEPY